MADEKQVTDSDAPGDPPSTSNGPATAANEPVCSCGAGRNAKNPNHCAKGHLLPGNDAAAIIGDHGARFFRDNDTQLAKIVAELLSDVGYPDPATAPLTIRITAHALAQSHLVNNAAYRKMLECGGPLAESGKPRRAYSVWREGIDSLTRDLKGAMNDLVAAHANGATRTPPTDLDTLTEDQVIERLEQLLASARAMRDAQRQGEAFIAAAAAEHRAAATTTSELKDEDIAPTAQQPAPAESVCEFCHQPPSRCAELKEHHTDAWRVLHHADPEEVARRDAEATAEMMHQIGRPLPDWYR